jgi:hypothetical protein
MLNELSMENFKPWKRIDNMRFAPITGIFGTNSSGKSSILQMLLLIKQSSESTDPTQVINLGDDRSPVRLGSFLDVIFNHDPNAALKLGIKWEEHAIGDEKRLRAIFDFPLSHRREFRSSLSADSSSGRVGVDEIYASSPPFELKVGKSQSIPGRYLLGVQYKGGPPPLRSFNVDDLPPPERFDAPAVPPLKPEKSDNLMSGFASSRSQMPHLMLTSLSRKISYLGPLRHPPQRTYHWRGVATADVGYAGERAMDVMLSERNAGTIPAVAGTDFHLSLELEVSFWLGKLGLSKGSKLVPISEKGEIFELQMSLAAEGKKVLLPDVGFGVSQVLPVIVLCCSAPPDSTIILEQPELHLHPAAQSALADLFIYAARERGVQIIFESHSEHLLRRIQRRIAEEKLKTEETAIYFCEPGGTEGSKLTTLEVDPFGNISNWPKGFFGDEFGEMAEMAMAAAKRKAGQSE